MKLRIRKKTLEFSLIPVIAALSLAAIVVIGYAGGIGLNRKPADLTAQCAEHLIENPAELVKINKEYVLRAIHNLGALETEIVEED